MPVPEAGGAIMRKGAAVVAVHAHDGSEAPTVKLPVPPASGTVPVGGVSVKEQVTAAPACVMVTVCPAMVRVPVRLVELVLASTL